ncbi:hypothetical protein BDW66DRAFT_140384 [Aspergillus desertorum]
MDNNLLLKSGQLVPLYEAQGKDNPKFLTGSLTTSSAPLSVPPTDAPIWTSTPWCRL